MSNRVAVKARGISRDLKRANGASDLIEVGSMDKERLIELFKKLQNIEPFHDSKQNSCNPDLIVKGPAGQFVFRFPGKKIYNIETDADVTPFEAAMMCVGLQDSAEIAKRAIYLKGLTPLRRPEADPTESSLQPDRINVSSKMPHIKQSVYKSNGWRVLFYANFFTGACFIIPAGTLMLSAGAGKAALFGLAAIVAGVFTVLFSILIKVTGQEAFRLGFDWDTNTMWIDRESCDRVHFEANANMISDITLCPLDMDEENLYVPGEGIYNKKGRQGKWGMKVARNDSPEPTWLVGSWMISHSQADKALKKTLFLLQSQT